MKAKGREETSRGNLLAGSLTIRQRNQLLKGLQRCLKVHRCHMRAGSPLQIEVRTEHGKGFPSRVRAAKPHSWKYVFPALSFLEKFGLDWLEPNLCLGSDVAELTRVERMRLRNTRQHSRYSRSGRGVSALHAAARGLLTLS